MKKNIITLLIAGFLLSGCGGGSKTTEAPVDNMQNAITLISHYAEGETTSPPSVQDYVDAGIYGVSDSNIDEINALIASHTGEEVDTQEEIQAIVDSVNINHIPIVDAGGNVTVTVNQSVLLQGTAHDEDGEIVSYAWKEDDTLLSTDTKLTYVSSIAGEHILTFYATDNDGATASDTLTVNVIQNTENTEQSIIHINQNYQVIDLGQNREINARITIDNNAHKDLYILFSNYSRSSVANTTITHSAKNTLSTNQQNLKNTLPTPYSSILPPAYHIREFNRHLVAPNIQSQEQTNKIVITKSYAQQEGDSNTFYLEQSSGDASTDATLRKVIADIDTKYGTKNLNVWVSNDSFDDGSGCEKHTCVTQEMVDALADTFLKDGSNNDIYDWVTNIFGEEWGADAQEKYSNLIGQTDTIDILLTDIDNDNSENGGVIGYFYAKDNYESSSVSGSNEKIMFYADSVMFANGGSDGTWSLEEDFWPKEMVSTLAHEFQHMIHFYQKTILQTSGSATDTWINELLSETVEDVISTKIKHNGPRGVNYLDGSAGDPNNPNGRYPEFNSHNTLSLTDWDNTLADYSKVNAFGAYLTRNYGVQVLHDIMHSPYTHEDAIEKAVQQTPQGEGKTFNTLLREWGIAVMLSSLENPVDLPTYNTGAFINNTYGQITYDLGSINFFNYTPQPKLYTTSSSVQPQGNYYYKIGENLSGSVDINITLNGTTTATLIAK